MTSKNFDFDSTIGYTRKKFGATPDKVIDPSQIPTVKISDNNFIEHPSNSTSNHLHNLEVAENNTSTSEQLQKRPVPSSATVKPASSRISINKTLLDMKIKTSADCLRMYYLIHELTQELNNTWIEIARTDFESNGIRRGRLVSAREEGVERQLFEFREIKALNKKNIEYIKGYEYRLITK